MYVTGLTLEVQGGGRVAEELSLVMLEIVSPSPGLKAWATQALTNVGPLEILGTAWIGDKLYLPVHQRNADYGSQRMNWLAGCAESYVSTVATALNWEL